MEQPKKPESKKPGMPKSGVTINPKSQARSQEQDGVQGKPKSKSGVTINPKTGK